MINHQNDHILPLLQLSPFLPADVHTFISIIPMDEKALGAMTDSSAKPGNTTVRENLQKHYIQCLECS